MTKRTTTRSIVSIASATVAATLAAVGIAGATNNSSPQPTSAAQPPTVSLDGRSVESVPAVSLQEAGTAKLSRETGHAIPAQPLSASGR